MRKRYKYLFKNLKILTLSNFASKILVFLLVPLYTSVLSTEEYGVFDLVLTTIQLLFPILSLNIVDALMRFLLSSDTESTHVISFAIKYIFIALVLGGLSILIVHFIPLFKQICGLEVYLYTYYVFYVLNQFFVQLSKGLERIKELGIASVLSTIVMILGNVLFLLVFEWGIKGFFIANIFALFVSVVFLACKLRIWCYVKSTGKKKDLEVEMLKYCMPLIFTVVGWWINSAFDRYAVVTMIGIAANGLLSVSYKIPSIINTVQGVFIQAWQISAIKEYDKEDAKSFYGNSFEILNLFMVFMCAMLILFTKPLAQILYSNDFFQAWQYVPFLIISNVINTSAGFMGPILSAKKNSKTMAVSAIYGAIVNMILNIILISILGIQGATLATMISSFIIYQIRRNATKNDFEIDRYPLIMISWILLVLQAFIEIYIQNYYIELIVLVIIFVIYSKPLIKIIKYGIGHTLESGLKKELEGEE